MATFSAEFPAFVQSEVNAKIARLSRQLARIKAPAMDVKISNAEPRYLYGGGIHTKPSSSGLHQIVPYVKLDIEYDVLHIAGDWIFCGSLEPLGDENVMRSIPGESIPEEFRTKILTCDHCHTHRKRSETFVVKNKLTGEYKNVGRSCLKAFLGYSPDSVLVFVDWFGDLSKQCDGDSWGFGSAQHELPVASFLAYVAKIIQVDGWRPKSMDGVPTCHVAWDIMMDRKPFNWSQAAWDEYKAERTPAEGEFSQLVEDARRWVDEQPRDSDFIGNLQVIGRQLSVSWRNCGFCAYIIPAFTKEQVRRKEAAVKISEYLPNVQLKDRVTIDVLVHKVIPIETQYGTSGLHIMEDKDGRAIIWFASGEWIKEGEAVKIKATIVKFTERDGRKQTQVNRVVVLDPK